MAPVVPRDIELSRRRARSREDALVLLGERGRATLGEMSLGLGVRPSRVVGIFEGLGREYARDLSLTRLGAAVVLQVDGARAYAITALGERLVGEGARRV